MCPIYYKQTVQQTLQDTGRAPYGARQPEKHAAQDGESKITIKNVVQKEMSVLLLYACPALERVRRKTLGTAWMEPNQIKEVKQGDEMPEP